MIAVIVIGSMAVAATIGWLIGLELGHAEHQDQTTERSR